MQKKNLAEEHPEKVAQLTALYDAWLEPMPNSVKGDPKRWGQSEEKPPTERKRTREQRLQERLKAKQAEKLDQR